MRHIKLHPKYIPLIKEKSRYTLVSGSRASGKSFSVAVYLLLKTFETEQVILFSRYTMTSAEISVIPEFQEKLELLEIEHLFEITNKEIINKITGSRIIFRGLKTGSKIQTANLKSISGLNIWVLDEAEELVDENLFDKISNSIRTKHSENKIILVFNPPTKQHWIYNRFYIQNGVEPGSNETKNNTTYIHTTYLDNLKHLDKDFIDEANQLKETNYDKWKRIFQGAFRDKAQGIIFNNWQLKEFPKDVDVEYGLDFGYTDPNAMSKIYIDHDKKEVYVKEMLYKSNMSISDLVKFIKNNTNGKDLIIADSASPATIQEIKNNNINIRGARKIKIVEGIGIMLNYKLLIDPSSKNLINELNNYTWDSNYKKEERPIDDFNHILDSVRYIIVERTKNRKIKRFRIG